MIRSQTSQGPVAVVQARASSRRLPNKVLINVCGQPLLAYTLQRLQHCHALHEVLIATSLQSDDDPIAALGESLGARVHRGPLDDVLQRIIDAARSVGAVNVVRISGDSPLIDPLIVDEVVECFMRDPCDLATNVFPRSFPKGQSVEVIAGAALERVASSTNDGADREHVTRYIYCNPDRFLIRNVSSGRDLGDFQLSVDTADDLTLTARIIANMKRPHWEYGLNEILAIRASILHEHADPSMGHAR